MRGRRTVGVAVAAALVGAAAGYTVGRRDPQPAARAPQPGRVIKVTSRQVRAAQIAIKGHKRLGKPVPPGLQRIAEARRPSLTAPAERVGRGDVTTNGDRSDSVGMVGR